MQLRVIVGQNLQAYPVAISRHSLNSNHPKEQTLKLYSYQHGDVLVEKLSPSGMYLVQLRSASGELQDKVRCDDYRMAMTYKRAFMAIAKCSSPKP